ncbi:unnamed protein product [Closterium sp. NIES-54]
MYALSFSAEGDYYRCVPPDPGIVAAALGASASGTPPGSAPTEALHTFTLDSSALRCFFRDSTTLTPLPAPVPVRLANPSEGPVIARSSTVLPCLAVPSGSQSGLHLPSFSTNLVSTAALQDAIVTTTTPGGQCVSICMCTRTGRHLATFTRRPGSSLYTLTTEPPQVAASAQVSVSRQVATSCSCRLLSHETLLWHHRLGHPSLPRLRGMHSRFLIFGLPSKGEVVDVLIPWIRTVRLLLRERFGTDLPILRLHSARGGEFSSDLLRDFCRGEGILQSFTLPDSPRQNGIAEHHFGLVMEVARTSMIHAALPHFLWPFAVRYAAHQLNLWPRVSLPETSPTLRWTGKVGDASVFWVWDSCAFVRDTSADKLSARAIPCVFLGFVPDAPGWQFYHPTSRCVLPSQDVMLDESVPLYRLFPYHSAPPPPPPLFFAPGPPPVDPLPPKGPAPSGVSQVDPLLGTAPVQIAVGSGAAPGAESGGAASGGAEPGGAGSEGAGSGGAEPEGVEPGGAESEGVESRGAEPRGAASSGGPGGASPRLSSQQLHEWLVQRAHRRSEAPGARGAGNTGAASVAVPAGAGSTGGAAAIGLGGARTSGGGGAGTGPGAGGPRAARARVGGTGTGGAEPAGAGAVDPGAGGARGTVRPRPQPTHCLLPLLTLSTPVVLQSVVSLRLVLSRLFALLDALLVRVLLLSPGTHAMALRPSSVPLRVSLPAPHESSLPEVPDPASDRARASNPTVSYLLATTVTDPSFESAASSDLVAELLDFAAACRLDYTIALVAECAFSCPPSIGGECALGTDVLEDRQEDLECLAPSVPRFASMLLGSQGDCDAPDILTPRSYVEAIEGPYSSHWQAAMDAEMASWKSTSTPGVEYFQTFSPTPKMTTFRVLLHVAAQRDYDLHSLDFSTAFLQGILHEEIWLRRPPGFTGTFRAGTQWSLRWPVDNLRQAPREWQDTLRTTLAALGFTPSTADPSLFLRTDTSLPPFYVLLYVDDLVFATVDTEALTLVKLEMQKRHTCTDLGEMRSYLGLQITRDRARRTITLTCHSFSAPPSDESVEPSGPYPELVGCLITSGMGLVLGGRGPIFLTGHADVFWVDNSTTQRSSQGNTFGLVCLQLRERFREDLLVPRLHFDRGGEFSSDLLREFYRGEGILKFFTFPASPQQNGIDERRIGLVMEVTRTSMIHAAAPHFLWPFAVWYAAHQLNLWPCVSLPETLPICVGRGRLAMRRCSGSGALVPLFAILRQTSSPPALFHASSLAFPLTRLADSFTTPPRACPPLSGRHGPAPSGVPEVDPLPLAVPVEVALDSGATRGAASGGAASGVTGPEGAECGGAQSEGAESGGANPGGAEPGGTEPEGAKPGGAESEGAEPWGTASARGLPWGRAGASPRLSHRREPLSPQQLR